MYTKRNIQKVINAFAKEFGRAALMRVNVDILDMEKTSVCLCGQMFGVGQWAKTCSAIRYRYLPNLDVMALTCTNGNYNDEGVNDNSVLNKWKDALREYQTKNA